jgi:CBS domain-containing protein
MIKVKQLLESKGRKVWSIAPGDTVYEALEKMADKDVGALLVMEGKTPVGIFSERDYARKIILKGKFSKDTPVSEVMERKLTFVSPGETIAHCMALMTQRHIRHLPVMEKGRLSGIVSIGDVVNQIISEQESTINELENYITHQVG